VFFHIPMPERICIGSNVMVIHKLPLAEHIYVKYVRHIGLQNKSSNTFKVLPSFGPFDVSNIACHDHGRIITYFCSREWVILTI
jgi:hypothetical protein